MVDTIRAVSTVKPPEQRIVLHPIAWDAAKAASLWLS